MASCKSRLLHLSLIYLLGGYLTLHGVTTAHAQSAVLPAPEQAASADAQTTIAKPVVSTLSSAGTIRIETYEVGDILERLASEAGRPGKEGKIWLAKRIRSFFPAAHPVAGSGASVASVRSSDGKQLEMRLDSNGCGICFDEEQVVVSCPKASQKGISQSLETLRQFGIRQVVIQTYVFRGSVEQIQQLPIDWTPVESASQIAQQVGSQATPVQSNPANTFQQPEHSVVPASFLASRQEAPVEQLPPSDERPGNWTEASSIVERSTPVLYTLLSGDQYESLLGTLSEQPQISGLMHPTVVVFNGQVANVSDNVQRPFVTGIQPMRVGPAEKRTVEFAPKIRIYPEGTTMKMRPELIDGDRVRLTYHLDLCQVRKVETLDIPRFDGGGKLTVQMPEVATTRFRTCQELPVDYALAVAAFETDEDGVDHSYLILCQCRVHDIEQENHSAASQ